MSFPINAYKWKKFGLTYSSGDWNPTWGKSHALVPTPVVLNSKHVAIYSSFIDDEFRGRIGRVDIGFENNKPEVLRVLKEPVLDLGEKGTFSQFGVGMGAFWPNKPTGDLFYVAFDRPAGFKFKAFTGKAVFDSASGRYFPERPVPIFGPEMGGTTIVGLHDFFENDGNIHALISIGSGFELIGEKEFPKYQVHLASGNDIEHLTIAKSPIINAVSPTYRIGRPRITKIAGGFEILVTAGTLEGSYLPEAYYSTDLRSWTKGSVDNFASKTVDGFDDLHQCYLARFSLGEDEWIVYNGNYMGVDGFGFARGELIAN